MRVDEPTTDGRVRRARELRGERREQLLESARRVFARQGYAATSIQDLLDEAGVARGTFYLHWSGKRAVFEALLDRFLDALASVIVKVDVTSEVPAGEQLRGNVERIMDLLFENRDLTRVLLREASGLDRELDGKLVEFDDRVLALLEGSLRTGVALGLVRPGPLRLRAVFVLGAVKEGVEHVLLRSPRTGDPPPDRRELGREFMGFVLRGLLRADLPGL